MISSDLANMADQLEGYLESGLPLSQHDVRALVAGLRDCGGRAAVMEAMPVPDEGRSTPGAFGRVVSLDLAGARLRRRRPMAGSFPAA